MRIRSWLLPALVAVPLVWAGTDALSCIRFNKPGGSVPPGLREPEDPEPPPNSETPPDSTTPPSEGTPPTTPPATTPTPPPTTPGTGGPQTGGPDADRAKPAADDSTWETWWELNRIEFFPRRWVQSVVTGDGPVRATPERLDAEVVKTKLLPMLLRCSEDKHMFVQEAALITMGRVAGTEEQLAAAREILLKKIRHRHHEIARAAALGLFYVADSASILPMFEVAKDEKTPEDVRAFLALTITTLKHPMAAGLLRELADVREGFYELVGSSLMALGYNGTEEDEWIPEFLEKVYENGKARGSYRALAVESLVRIGSLDGHKLLLRAMGDREIEVRRSAVIALGCLEYRTPAEREIEAIRAPYLDYLGKPLTKEDEAKIKDLETQIAAQREKTDPTIRSIVKALAQAMEKDNDGFVRHMCAISLGRIARATPQSLAVNLLEREWKQDKYAQREFALLGLALARAPSTFDAATSAITGKNRDPSTRSAGAIALGILGDAKADPVLRDLVSKDPHPHIRGYAAIALGMIGTPGSADLILSTIKSTKTPVTRAYGALGLCLLGTRKGTDFLTSVLESDQVKDMFVSSHMVYALGLTKDRSQLDRLVKIADDSSRDMYIRSATIAAIGYVSSAEFYPHRHLMARGYNYMLNMDYISTYFYKL
jgi:HEAT repeat protein